MNRNVMRIATLAFAALPIVASAIGTAYAAEELSCPQVSPTSSFSGSLLDELTESKDGVVFDETGPIELLRLKKAGGYFKSTLLGTSDLTVFAAVADFDGDGWEDFVGGGESSSWLKVYRNKSFENLPVNWDDPDDILQPKFVTVYNLKNGGNEGWWHPLATGDFNGDGRPDVFYASAWAYQRPFAAHVYINDGNDAAGNPRFQARAWAMAPGTSASALGYQNWGGTHISVVDYNGDRKLDMLVGSGETNGGSVRIFLNQCDLVSPLPDPLPATGPLPCSNRPQFAYSGYLVRDMGLGGNGRGEFPTLAFEDFDGDGRRDLVAGAPLCCSSASSRLRIWYGVDGGGVEASASQYLSFPGAATAVLAGDFSLDGRMDLIVGTDNWNYPWSYHIGGQTFYYENDGDSEPFSGGVTQQLTSHQDPHGGSNLYDFDLGFVFNYDNDPDNTPDIMIADGNHSGSFYVFANRVVSEYVSCGDVASGVLELGELSDEEMVVTSARLTPQHSTNGGSIQYFLSNEDPPVWVEATEAACGDASGDLCANFDRPVGREVRWKATMCSNAFNTTTPEITGIDVQFGYTKASVHYRSGVVVYDGISYSGGFRQPGDRGHLFATNLGNATAEAGTGTVYWDAAEKLDGMFDSDRHLYMASPDGTARIDLDTATASDAAMHDALGLPPGASSSTDTSTAVVNWVRSGRFGVGNTGVVLSKHGAIETSTAAVLSKPGPPPWYGFMTEADKTKWDLFAQAHEDRIPLVIYGAKDQLIHAVYSNATDLSDVRNGTEAWGIAPPTVVRGMVTDFFNSLGDNLDIRAYPDGSPTLADVKFADNEFHTVAIVAAGNGGRSVFAMDVTETVLDDGTVVGPTPLWTWTPGASDAGFAFSKPVVIRVEIADQERFLAVFGSGIDRQASDKGRRIVAVDVETGAHVWQFETACALTSDVAAFETNDELESGDPVFDGSVDRVVFADECGNVYKIDPQIEVPLDGVELGYVYGIGSITTGNGSVALFSTQSSEALMQQRPIVGTIGARVDSTDRMVLYFGTGGLESYDPTLDNVFFAVYADDGEVRSTLAGGCDASGRCEKFYGGVVVTADQVLVTRATDPPLTSGSCELGSTVIEGFGLETNPDGDFVEDFSVSVASATVAALFGDAGAIYTSTLDGSIIRIGTPRATGAGADSASGAGGGFTAGGEAGQGGGGVDPDAMANTPFTLLGWFQHL